MAELSKTARASLRVGAGNTRHPLAWVFLRIPGKIQARPVRTFFNDEELKAYIAKMDHERFVVVYQGLTNNGR